MKKYFPDWLRNSTVSGFVAVMMLAPNCSARVSSQSFEPCKQGSITARNGEIVARSVIPKNYCADSHSRLQIDITNGSKSITSFHLPQVTSMINDMQFVPGDRLIIFGQANWAVSTVLIYDLSSQKISDHFWAYEPILSPDKKLLIYEKFYPQHFVEGVSSEYLLYDLTKSAEANRPEEIKLSDLENVGTPVYPAGSRNTPGDNEGLSESKIHSLSSDSFYWSRDSKRVAFVDHHQHAQTLVIVGFLSGGFKVSTEYLPTQAIINPEGVRGICEGPDPESWFHVAQITFDVKDTSRLQLEFAAQAPRCLSVKALNVSYNY